MLPTNIEKIIELQGQYIDRININAMKLNKKLQFLVNIGDQLGGTQSKNKDVVLNLINELRTQTDYITTDILNNQKKITHLGQQIELMVIAYAKLTSTNVKLIAINSQLTETNEQLRKAEDNTKITKSKLHAKSTPPTSPKSDVKKWDSSSKPNIKIR